MQQPRVILITGAGGEIGSCLARSVAQVGDTVYLGGRSRAKLEQLVTALRAAGVRAELEPFVIDLGNLQSIRSSAESLRNETTRLDLLFANAGIMATSRQTTRDGFEEQLGVCHLGHFALVSHLLPLLQRSESARVVTTTSSAAWYGRISFDDLMLERKYTRYGAYCQAKLANVLFAFELDRRCREAGLALAANSAHPGFVYGHLQEHALEHAGWFEKFLYRVLVKRVIAQPVEEGVKPLLMAADPSESGGNLYGPKWLARGASARVKPPRRCRDASAARRLWEVSEELTGLSPPIG